MKTIKRQRMVEEDAAIVVVPVPFAEYYRCDEPTEDNYRAAGYVPADYAVAQVRDLEGQIVEATQAADRLMNDLTASASRVTEVEQQNATLREMVGEVDCLRENAVTLRRSAEHWEKSASDEKQRGDAYRDDMHRIARERDAAESRAAAAERGCMGCAHDGGGSDCDACDYPEWPHWEPRSAAADDRRTWGWRGRESGMTTKTRPMMPLEKIAIETLKCALSWEPNVCLIGSVMASEVATLAASRVTSCPKCGAEPWVNIDCDLCLVCSSLEHGEMP